MTLTRCGRFFHIVRLIFTYRSAPILLPRPRRNATGLGSSAFARHYSRNHCCFLLLRVLRCFSSPRSPHARHDDAIACIGFPHSDIRGSIRICRSPRLFAAYHVLLRLWEPQASPMRPSLAFLFPSFDSLFHLRLPFRVSLRRCSILKFSSSSYLFARDPISP